MRVLIIILSLLLAPLATFAQTTEQHIGNQTYRYDSRTNKSSTDYNYPNSTIRFNSDGSSETIYHYPRNPNYNNPNRSNQKPYNYNDRRNNNR